MRITKPILNDANQTAHFYQPCSWKPLLHAINLFPGDIEVQRDQPPHQVRKELENWIQ